MEKERKTRRKKSESERRLFVSLSISDWDGRARKSTLKYLAGEYYKRDPESFTNEELVYFAQKWFYEHFDAEVSKRTEDLSKERIKEADSLREKYLSDLLKDIEAAGDAVLPGDVQVIALKTGLNDGVKRTYQEISAVLGVTRQNAEQKFSRGMLAIGRKPEKRAPELADWTKDRVLTGIRGINTENEDPRTILAYKALEKMYEGEKPKSYRKVAAEIHVTPKTAKLLITLAIREIEKAEQE